MNIIISFLLLLLIFNCIESYKINQTNDVQNRIVSGEAASSGQLPWQVVLKRDGTDDLLCGASIISNVWVLTAAHCTYGLSSVYLMFGTILLNNENAVSMTSTSLFVHPDYNSVNLNNDISLIGLPTPLTFSTYIQPIPLILTSQANDNFQGTEAIVAGFGLMNDEDMEYSEQLQYAFVEIIDNQQCLAIFGSEIVISSTLCAKGSNSSNMSICSGDSGGPLVIKNDLGYYFQIGINSFVAQDMCTEGFPSGYVRLSSYLDYITEITNINFSK